MSVLFVLCLINSPILMECQSEPPEIGSSLWWGARDRISPRVGELNLGKCSCGGRWDRGSFRCEATRDDDQYDHYPRQFLVGASILFDGFIYGAKFTS